MLLLTRHDHPYPHATGDLSAWDGWTHIDVDHLFRDDQDWVRHDSFYQCHMATHHPTQPANAIDGFGSAALDDIRRSLEQLFATPLTNHRYVTAQRLSAGDQATIHTDAPALGFETHRLVIHLDAQQEQHGSLLVQTADGRVIRRIDPTPGSAFAFALRPDSFHTVLPCTEQRRSLVIHFWHPGNAQAVADLVHSWLNDLDYRQLPNGLEQGLALTEDSQQRASMVAWVMIKMGCAKDQVFHAFRQIADLDAWDAWTAQDMDGWTALACWAVELSLDGFVRQRYEQAKAVILETNADPCLSHALLGLDAASATATPIGPGGN